MGAVGPLRTASTITSPPGWGSLRSHGFVCCCTGAGRSPECCPEQALGAALGARSDGGPRMLPQLPPPSPNSSPCPSAWQLSSGPPRCPGFAVPPPWMPAAAAQVPLPQFPHTQRPRPRPWGAVPPPSRPSPSPRRQQWAPPGHRAPRRNSLWQPGPAARTAARARPQPAPCWNLQAVLTHYSVDASRWLPPPRHASPPPAGSAAVPGPQLPRAEGCEAVPKTSPSSSPASIFLPRL